MLHFGIITFEGIFNFASVIKAKNSIIYSGSYLGYEVDGACGQAKPAKGVRHVSWVGSGGWVRNIIYCISQLLLFVAR
jgi:hypothetical protein